MKTLAWPLRVYVAVIIAAATAILAFGATRGDAVNLAMLVNAGILFALTWLAERHPVHLGPKTKVTVDTAPLFAAALVLTPFVAMLVAGGAKVAGLRVNGKVPLRNRLFNASAALLATGLSAFAFRALTSGGSVVDEPLGLAAAAVVGYVVRTEIVDVAIALQLRRPLLAAWWLDHRRDLTQEAALFALGALAAAVAYRAPWMFALFVAPVALILVSFRETVRLRGRTREAVLHLADLIDARDSYTFGHSQRVAEYAARLARRLRMPPSQVELVREAARLHDVGKISTEDRILQKAGRLTDPEAAEMRKHCEAGYRFLKQLPEFWEGAELVRLHHERYDGMGYPRGLGGTALPQEASVIAVADAWDAMTSDRPYRKALGPEQARAELLRCRGTQWDPFVVDAFLALLDEGRAARAVPAVAPATSYVTSR